MSEFITLKKSDPEFESYLTGSFSEDHFAIPIKHFQFTGDESVTFEVRPKENISLNQKTSAFFELIRWRLLSLTVLPTAIVLLMLREQALQVAAYEYFLALGSLLLFHSSLFAWNDYKDHMRGWDIARQKAGTRTIQKGLMSAGQVKAIAWLCLVGSVLLAAPVAFDRWALILFAGVAFSLAGLALSAKSKMKLKLVADQVVIFWCFGPLLVFGSQYFISESFYTSFNLIFLFISFYLGLAACLYFQARQFSHLMTDDRQKIKTLAVHLGFDRMKRFLVLQLGILALSIVALLAIMQMSFWVWLCAAPVIFWLARLAQITRRVESPVSSSLLRLPNLYLANHWLLCFWLIVEASF